MTLTVGSDGNNAGLDLFVRPGTGSLSSQIFRAEGQECSNVVGGILNRRLLPLLLAGLATLPWLPRSRRELPPYAGGGKEDGLSMTRAQRRGRELRRELGLRGRVDAEAVADHLGLEVFSWPFQVLQEMKVDNSIAVAERLDAPWRRWVVAHAIGHSLLHPGNHLWMQDHTLLGHRVEREAEEFASALLVDEDEALEQGLVHPWEVAEYFGVPEELVSKQAPWSGE